MHLGAVFIKGNFDDLSCCPGSGVLQGDCKMNHCFQVSFMVEFQWISHSNLPFGKTMLNLGSDSQNLPETTFSPPRPGALVRTVGSMPSVAT